jgi:hypothetical protein
MGFLDFLSNYKFYIAGISFFVLLVGACTVVLLFAMGFFSHTPAPASTPYIVPTQLPYSLNASLSNDTIPTVMDPGKKYDISIIVLNTGNTSWSHDNHITMAVADGNNDSAFFGNTSFTIAPGTVVKSGDKYNWKFSLTAPQWAGNYTLAYRMKNDTGYWFGDTLIKEVTVGTPEDTAVFVSQKITYYPPVVNQSSISMKRNSWQNISISVKNMGRFNWSEPDNVRLVAVDYEPNDAVKFNQEIIHHIAPYRTIIPGDIAMWGLKLNAPQYPGTYHIKYRMQKDGRWFGSTLDVTITVT